MAAVGILIALCVLVTGLISIRRAPWAAGIIIMVFPLEQLLQSYFPALVATPWLINFAMGGMGLAAVAVRFLRGEDVTYGYFNPILILILLIYAYQVVGWTWSPGGAHAMASAKRGFLYVSLNVLILPLLIRDLEDLRSTIRFLLFFGTAVVLLTLFNPRAGFMTGRLRLELGEYGLITGNPLATGYGGGVVAIVAALSSFRRNTLIVNALRVGAFMAGMAMAVLSGSRGQAFGAALVVILLYPAARKVRDIKQFFGVSFGLMTLGLLVYAAFRLFITSENEVRYTSGTTEALSARWYRITSIMEAFLARPESWITGLGPGSFSVVTGLNYAHNVPVEILTELGLIGIGMFGTMLILLLLYTKRTIKSVAEDPVYRATATTLAAICLFDFILSCKQGSIISTVGPMGTLALTGRVMYTHLKSVKAASLEAGELDEHEPDEYDFSEYGDFSDYGEHPDYGDGDFAPAT